LRSRGVYSLVILPFKNKKKIEPFGIRIKINLGFGFIYR